VGSIALEHVEMMERHMVDTSTIRQDLIGESTVMADLGRQIRKIAPTDSTVLILGESGT
jgi:DNA-binding NtrC family response regulator